MFKRIIGFVAFAFIAACGSGGSDHLPTAGGPPPGGTGNGGTDGSGTTTVRIGNGTGSSFNEGAIAISSTDLSAGGSASLQVAIVDQTGALYTQPVTVTFSSLCSAQQRAVITPASVDTSTGIANATYAAQGCSGADVVTASATANSQQLTANGTINVLSAAIGSIEFVSATPANIALRGTGGAGRQETSTVVFKVVDSTGGPRADADVTFSLDTAVGGINLTSTSARSDVNGRVQTVVNAGTVATPVRVTAKISSPSLSTQSNELTVTTGIPDSDSVSVAPQCPNVEAYGYDGVSVPVTVRLADRFNNPVPDGTAVAFTAEGGKIGSQCTTGNVNDEAGVCTVNWVSADPRPLDGRVTILATAIGEDSFTDNNANGFYDTGEPFADLGEPYRDDNENTAYDNGEFFLDFNNDNARQSSDGTFSGVICTGSSQGSTCNLTTTAIGRQTLIVMSTSAAIITGPSSKTGSAGQGIQLDYVISDLYGNAMPNGTTITATANTNAGQLDQPTSFVVPCDSSVGGTPISLFLTLPNPLTGSGAVTITVKSPKGLITTFRTNIN